MGYGFRYDATGTECSKGPQPGAVALGKWAKARWNLPLIGIFNCRMSRAGNSLSTHGEGRGIDAHVHVRASEAPPTPAEKAIGDAMFALFTAIAEAVGVQAVIWLDQRWDARTRQVKHYTGPFHGNHVHIELCWPAAKQLTGADIQAAAGSTQEDPFMALTEDEQREMLTKVRNLSTTFNTDEGHVGPLGGVLIRLDAARAAATDPKSFAKAVAAEIDGLTPEQLEEAFTNVLRRGTDAQN